MKRVKSLFKEAGTSNQIQAIQNRHDLVRLVPLLVDRHRDPDFVDARPNREKVAILGALQTQNDPRAGLPLLALLVRRRALVGLCTPLSFLRAALCGARFLYTDVAFFARRSVRRALFDSGCCLYCAPLCAARAFRFRMLPFIYAPLCAARALCSRPIYWFTNNYNIS